MDQRGIAVPGRGVLLAGLLAAAGLAVPVQAAARPASRAWGARPAAYGAADTSADGGRRMGRGKKRHKRARGAAAAGENDSVANYLGRGGGGGGGSRTRKKARGGGASRGGEERAACAEALQKGKDEAAQDTHLRKANEWFAQCAQASCGRAMSKRCGAVYSRISAMLPSVVPVVTDASGGVSNDVQVRMDGAILTNTLDGTPIAVDPGDHEFTFAKGGEVFATRSLTLQRGQQHRLVSATLQPRQPAPVAEEERPRARAPAAAPRKVAAAAVVAKKEEEESEGEKPAAVAAEDEAAPAAESTPTLARRERRRSGETADSGAPWSAYALAGVGAVGLGGAALLNLKGSADNDALIQNCKPDCKPTSVRHVRNLYLAADVSLVVGLAALAGSTYLFFDTPDTAVEEESRRARRGRISSLGVEPTPSGGAMATVAGTF